MKGILLFIACCLFTAAYGQGSGRALSFDGTRVTPGSPEATIPAGVRINRSFFNQRAQYTWEAWVFPTDPLYCHLFTEGNPLTTFAISLINGQVILATWNQGTPGNWTGVGTATGLVPNNQWTHVAISMNSGTVRIYINGSLADEFLNVPGQNNGATALASVGINTGFASQPDQPFSGRLDELRIWDRALTQDEIRHKLTERLAGAEPGLLAYYRLDEGADNTCPGGQDVCDASGNGNHAVKF
ncbi:MAG: LamG domain-containing protein [Sphingobacteriia bacterium]